MMKKALVSVAAVAAMLALGACASQEAKAPAKPKTMTGPEVAKAFKKGSKQCDVVLADGTKAEDFYYKNKTAMSGDLDRNIGSATKQGQWKILGPGFWVKIGKGKKVRGTWMNLAKTGKKSFDAYNSAGKKVMSMKCK
jgi:hypothetical protein